jgi:hypothetical protein
VVALTYQSQLTTLMAATLLQWAEQQFAHLASQQNLMHENMHQIIAQVNALSLTKAMQGAEGLQASTAAAVDKDIPGASVVATKRQPMEASVAVVFFRLQAVIPMALPQWLHLIRVEAPPFSMLPQETVKGVQRSTFHPWKGTVQEVMATCPTWTYPRSPGLKQSKTVCKLECVLFMRI